MKNIPHPFFSFQTIRRTATLALLSGMLVSPLVQAQSVTQEPVPTTRELSLMTPLTIGGQSAAARGPQLSLHTCMAGGQSLATTDGRATAAPCTVQTLSVEDTDSIFAYIEKILSIGAGAQEGETPEAVPPPPTPTLPPAQPVHPETHDKD